MRPSKILVSRPSRWYARMHAGSGGPGAGPKGVHVASSVHRSIRIGRGRASWFAARRWFDYWLKDQDSAILDEAPVRLFVMGDNCWRDEDEWPIARTEALRLYLRGNGRANTLGGDGHLGHHPATDTEPPDRFGFDPADPSHHVAEPFCQAPPSRAPSTSANVSSV